MHDFKEVAKIAKKTKCRIKIKSKKGMPFVFNRYKKRKIFAILLICIFVSIIVFSNFIWNIEVTGTVDLVQREGLSIGKNKTKINTKEIIDKIRLERKDIAWVRNRY